MQIFTHPAAIQVQKLAFKKAEDASCKSFPQNNVTGMLLRLCLNYSKASNHAAFCMIDLFFSDLEDG
jgi:hypothetical protein